MVDRSPAPGLASKAESISGAAVALVYLVFLLSGAAALVYQVVWTRSLSLVFGGSHLAVTTVLAVFMGGLALGGHLFGRRITDSTRLFRLYGLLELGIAACAVVFAIVVRIYPSIYVPLARLAEASPLWLSTLRVVFAVALLLVPTTLMGGTLPVLAEFVAARTRDLGARLSFLYGLNTLGAVLGAGFAGFYLLPRFSVSVGLAVAVGLNLVLGVVGIGWNDRLQHRLASAAGKATAESGEAPGSPRPALRLVLWGIGVSGFCALGYEVLWTRVLSIVVGASVYGFTVMLMAFLTGIALGSAAYGAWHRARRRRASAAPGHPRASIVAFGAVQVAIGATALAVTVVLRDLPAHSLLVEELVLGEPATGFGARQWTSFLLAFLYMFVPAFFMGVAFPLAGRIRAEERRATAKAVGETLAYNTVGAILGTAVSGFVLVHLLGIERSLQLLALVNIGFGLVVAASAHGRRALTRGIAGTAVAAAAALVTSGDALRAWDPRFFAVFQANRSDKFATRDKVRDTLRNTEILYYAEGAQAIVSSIRVRGGTQSFVTNGRIEATDNAPDLACQYTLGHLPMLLHPDPRSVFVLGTGSGMTLGATSVHPSVERITLAEIEPEVLGVARTFAHLNHAVLDDPRLRVVFNDGRNFLLTTRDRFDVITADPIHPWFSGAGYLYTREYFELAASRLEPSGVMAQWLPIYELDEANLRAIVRTFREAFPHVLVWLTYYDAHLVGSEAPFAIDELVLARRIALPPVLRDLARVQMGSVDDLLSFFVMGDAGSAAYATGGRLNTDDNLYLEFSAPRSIENAALVAANFAGLVRHRESVLPHLVAATTPDARRRQLERASRRLAAAAFVDPIRIRDLAGELGLQDYAAVAAELDAVAGDYAPWRFLRAELARRAAQAPRIVAQVDFPVVAAGGAVTAVRLGAITRRMTAEITTLDFVDGRDGRVLLHHELLGLDAQRHATELVEAAMAAAGATYRDATAEAERSGEPAPREAEVLSLLRTTIADVIARLEPG